MSSTCKSFVEKQKYNIMHITANTKLKRKDRDFNGKAKRATRCF